MADVAPDHGQLNKVFGNTSMSSVAGSGVGNARTTISAASTTGITATGMTANAIIGFSAASSGAALLLSTNRCWVSAAAANLITFNCSATGAGAPAGTEIFNFVWVNLV